ncbi:MAG TPA: hypothetical protein GXZ90_04460 [Clostridiales bacterium]|nr:hypothetical protein [Clostridiales bacterium]
MRELREKWINDFTSLGVPVKSEGNTMVRPETRTSIAIGKVENLSEAGKNNLKLTIKVPGAKYDFSGFLNDNSPVSSLLKQAKEKNVPIAVRFEKKRKKGISPSIKIQELIKDSNTARDSIVNIVAGIYNFNNSEWILTDDAVSNPKEDPENIQRELDNASYSTSNFFNSGQKKIQTTDADWKTNHLISMFTYGSEHNLDNEIGLETKAIKVLASYMLAACDKVQMTALGIEAPNYSDYSHTKARGMLFSWMRINPLSIEIMGAKGGFSEWINRFIEESVEIWEWAKTESTK